MGLDASTSHGTVISRQDLGTGAFVDIAELLDITFPTLEHSNTETTAQGDDDDHFIIGVRRTSELQFSINWDPDGTTHGPSTGGLIKSWEDSQLDGYKLTYPDGSTMIFSGYITGIGVSAPMDDKLSADVTVRPTGAKAFV